MKQTLALTITLLTFSALAVDLIIPKTDDRTILRHPLNEGRIAYRELDNGNAALFIGKKNDPHPFSVIDPLTIRGYRTTYIPYDEYSVSYTAGFSYAGADNKYVLNNTLNVTNRIVFTVIGNREITSFDAYEKNLYSGGAGEVQCCTVTREVTEKQVIVTVVRKLSGQYYLQDPILLGVVEGSEMAYTDLVDDLHIKVKDEIGFSDLSKWRTWARDLYNGNRGEDWSHYKAKENVYMQKNNLVFGPTNQTMNALLIGSAYDDDKAVDFVSNGSVAMRIGPAPAGDSPPSGATITNLAFGVTNNFCHIVIQALNFPGFDINRLQLFWSDRVGSAYRNWQEVSFTHTGTNPYTLVTQKRSPDHGFYVIKYGSATAYIEVKCPMKVHDLRIVGTDNKVYQIRINAGVISAVEITE